MLPLYAMCPKCAFPVVVPAAQRLSRRQCRQCAAIYLPRPAGGMPTRTRPTARGPATQWMRRVLRALAAC
ncbi:MAG: hypothetical protein HY763_14965 [Planctomycetes bacterium]|nr:hypothetical protein [Planctomycetota bacterium]